MVDLTFRMADLEFFLMVLVRVTVFVYAAPFFGMTNTPNRVKIGIGVMLSVIVYYALGGTVHELEYISIFSFSVLVIKEAVTGLLIGFSASICTSILGFAGHLVDMETGLSMVTLFDSTSRDSMTITGVYYQYTVLLMLVISGLHQFVVGAIISSYKLIPVAGAIFDTEKLLSSIVTFMADYIVLGFTVSLPVFAALTILNAVLGILAKVSPQLNMFAVGIQLKILAGLGVMFLTVAMLPSVSSFIFTEMRKMVNLIIGAMT